MGFSQGKEILIEFYYSQLAFESFLLTIIVSEKLTKKFFVTIRVIREIFELPKWLKLV